MYDSAEQMTNSVGDDGIVVPRTVDRQTRPDNVLQLQMQMSIITCHYLYHFWIFLSVNFIPDSVSTLTKLQSVPNSKF